MAALISLNNFLGLIPNDDLDKPIDYKHRSARDLGWIADTMPEWKGIIADALQLTLAECVEIERGWYQENHSMQK